MVKNSVILLMGLILAMVFTSPGECLEARVVLRLQQAGISGPTIALIAGEKVIETCAFTADEIIRLKQAGLGEKTIRALVADGSFLKNRAPMVYGQSVQPLRLAGIDDLIQLKDAGFDDTVIQALITCFSGRSDTKAREHAWKMLEQIGIRVVPGRKAGRRRAH